MVYLNYVLPTVTDGFG